MIRWRRAVVTRVRREWAGVRELDVELEPDLEADRDGEPDGAGPAEYAEAPTARALAYVRLTGAPEPGDTVVLNTTALAMGLGTGGYAFVVALPDRLPPDSPNDPPQAPGHLVKARYSPMQATVLGADEEASPFYDVLRDADDLGGMPVISAALHSSLPAVVAGIRADAGDSLRVAYVMTDGGALPAWFSMTAAGLRDAGWLAATVSTGQAFGGDLEAVTLHSGLLVARHVVAADIAVVAQGPGNLGTGTRWGFGGVQAGEVVNAAATLGGRPVAALRISGNDPRDRHRGISHHSQTAFGRVALARCDIPLPRLGGDLSLLGELVTEQAAALSGRHRIVGIEVHGLMASLQSSPVRLSTMGRDLDADPAAFLAGAAAGRYAARLLAAGDPPAADV